jgi:hypothetical protein
MKSVDRKREMIITDGGLKEIQNPLQLNENKKEIERFLNFQRSNFCVIIPNANKDSPEVKDAIKQLRNMKIGNRKLDDVTYFVVDQGVTKIYTKGNQISLVPQKGWTEKDVPCVIIRCEYTHDFLSTMSICLLRDYLERKGKIEYSPPKPGESKSTFPEEVDRFITALYQVTHNVGDPNAHIRITLNYGNASNVMLSNENYIEGFGEAIYKLAKENGAKIRMEWDHTNKQFIIEKEGTEEGKHYYFCYP